MLLELILYNKIPYFYKEADLFIFFVILLEEMKKVGSIT